MNITPIYADEGGESHIDETHIEFEDAGEIGLLSKTIAAKSVIVRMNAPDYDYNWHVAPQRQLVVLLDGGIEIDSSDGGRRTLHDGELLLVEDTFGRGHRTRHVEARERRSLFILLDDSGMNSTGKQLL